MVLRSSVVEVHSPLTRLVVLTAVFLALTIGSWQIYGQLQAPVPSASQEESRGRGYVHLKLMEDSITTLASSLADIYPQADDRDLVPCDICSQDECVPLTGSQSCAKVKFNARCNSYYPHCPANSTLRVTVGQSSIGYPRALDGSGPDNPQTKTICGTVGLDSTFKTLYEKNPYHAQYYVGFPDGTSRNFPGKEEADPTSLRPCTENDCRLRPWYNAAISNRTHLVILVDSRRAEPLDASYTEKTDTLTLGKELANKLLATMSAGDRVNIVPFSSAATATALRSESVGVSFNQSDPQTHEELELLKQKLDELGAGPDDVTVSSSNLTAGLVEALRLFGDVSGMMTKNVLVFTNGGISFDKKLNTTLDQLYNKLVRLFIFSMKNTDDKHQALDSVAERAHGVHIRLPPKTSHNPIFQLRAYFRYMAEMQVRSKRTMPFWTPPYRDYYDIGQIITVVAPAFSKSEPKTLIGVVAIDVLYEELGDISEDFEIALNNRPDNGGSIDENEFRSISMKVYNVSLKISGRIIVRILFNVMASYDIKRKENVFCRSKNKVDPRQNFLERSCCSECSGGSDRLRTLRIPLPTAVLGFLFLVSLSLASAAVWCWRSRQSTLTVVEGEAGAEQDKLESPTGRKSSHSVGIESPRAKKVELGHYSSGTPLQIHKSVIRFGVDKFTLPPNTKETKIRSFTLM